MRLCINFGEENLYIDGATPSLKDLMARLRGRLKGRACRDSRRTRFVMSTKTPHRSEVSPLDDASR